MTNKTLIVTVGLPRAGKSTWARQQGHPIVNPDSIRLGLHGEAFNGLAEPFVWANAKLMVRALFLAGHDTVILDATSITKNRRKEWCSRDWNLRFVEFDTPEEVCSERVQSAGFTEGRALGLQHAISRMAAMREPIHESELKGMTDRTHEVIHYEEEMVA